LCTLPLALSALALVLGEDEDLAGMYLTDKANGKVHNVEDHQLAFEEVAQLGGADAEAQLGDCGRQRNGR
jgi:hypothetical protein